MPMIGLPDAQLVAREAEIEVALEIERRHAGIVGIVEPQLRAQAPLALASRRFGGAVACALVAIARPLPSATSRVAPAVMRSRFGQIIGPYCRPRNQLGRHSSRPMRIMPDHAASVRSRRLAGQGTRGHAQRARPGTRQRGKPCCKPSPPSTASARRMPSRCWPAPPRSPRQGRDIINLGIGQPDFRTPDAHRRGGRQGAARRPSRLHAGDRHPAAARGGGAPTCTSASTSRSRPTR